MADAEVRQLLRTLLAARLTPAARRSLAAELRQIADEQERLADAEQADRTRPARSRIAGSGGTKGGRPGATYLYLEIREPHAGRIEPLLYLRIGRGVYDAYQATRPDPRADLRFTVQITGDQLRLVEDACGYFTMVNAGGVRLNVSGARDHLGHLPNRVRWPARAISGAIVADLK